MEEEEGLSQNGRNHNTIHTNSSIQFEGNPSHMPKNISIQTLDVQWESIESNLNSKEKTQGVKFLKYEDFFNQPNQNGNNKPEKKFDCVIMGKFLQILMKTFSCIQEAIATLLS